MFDWKILAASFAALLVVSSVLVGGFGFTEVLDTLKDWLGEAPFEGFAISPAMPSKHAIVTFYPETFSLAMESSAFSIGNARFTDFSGDLVANFTSDTLELCQKDTEFRVAMALTEATLEDISLTHILLDDTEFHVTSNSLETSGQNASLEVSDFFGQVTIMDDRIVLAGNFSSIKGNGKPIV